MKIKLPILGLALALLLGGAVMNSSVASATTKTSNIQTVQQPVAKVDPHFFGAATRAATRAALTSGAFSVGKSVGKAVASSVFGNSSTSKSYYQESKYIFDL